MMKQTAGFLAGMALFVLSLIIFIFFQSRTAWGLPMFIGGLVVMAVTEWTIKEDHK